MNGILMNGVRFGFIESGFHQIGTEKPISQMKERADLVPLKQADMNEAAALMIYLLSGWASFITGQMIPLTGGDWLIMTVVLRESDRVPPSDSYNYWLAVTGTEADLLAQTRLPNLSRRLQKSFEKTRDSWLSIAPNGLENILTVACHTRQRVRLI